MPQTLTLSVTNSFKQGP